MATVKRVHFGGTVLIPAEVPERETLSDEEESLDEGLLCGHGEEDEASLTINDLSEEGSL